MSTIKVNELTQQTPALTDTLLASGENNEYSCNVGDLKTLIGRKEIYQDFTSKVSESRQIDMAQMDSIARGRVWVGFEALGVHLVDELGGLQRAILKAKELAGIMPNTNFALQYYPRRETFQEKLTKFIENGGNLPMVKVFDDFDELKVLYRLKHDAVLPPMVLKM